MSQPFQSESPSRGEQQGGGGVAGGGLLPFYHVPQQSRREKLRFPPCSVDVVDPLFMAIAPASSASSSFPNPSYGAPTPTQFDLDLHHYNAFFPHRQGSLSLLPVPPPPQPPPVCRGPAEPFTGYAAVLKGSRYLRPAQQILEEICDVGLARAALQGCTDGGAEALGEPEPLPSELASSSNDGAERRRTKTRLISMLDEVCRRYKQYYQQIQDVIVSFESVAGLDNATPYSALALSSMTKHFRSLKCAISDQLRCSDRSVPGKEGHSKDELSGFGFLNGTGVCYPGVANRAPGGSGAMIQPNVWRPQRGLPERAVAVLKGWLFEHFLHPYPSDADKHMLARQTGLSRNQVSNWFINARVRLWKPLVEEIHALEMRQARKATDQVETNRGGAGQSGDLPTTSTNHHSSDQPPHEITGFGKNPNSATVPKTYRNELTGIPDHIEEPMRFSFNDFSNGRVGAGASVPTSGNGGGVSLTLGLHQNNGICLPEPLPFNVARRFGLEDANTPYAVAGFDLQDRHFAKDIDGQLLRDFGG